MAFQALTGHVNKFVLFTNVTSSRTAIVCTCQDRDLPQQLHFKSNITLANHLLVFNPIYDLIRGDLCAHSFPGFSQYMFTECNKKKLAWKEKLAKIWQKPGSNDPRIKGCANPTLGGQQATCVLGSNNCRDG
jgi:hypothetical protein